MPRLSVTVITQDEEDNLPTLLCSVGAIADEVVVVDSGSRDRTVAIAREAGACVIENPWPGFREQKALALGHATGDWVLNLDADEFPTPELAAAISRELDRPGGPRHAGYRIHFRHSCFGRRVRFGQMWRDRRVRLFRREGASYGGSRVHPRTLVAGSIGDLPGRCDHDGYRTLEEARSKLARDAAQVARERFEAGHRSRPWYLLRWPAGFLKRYVLRLGFLDGAAGLRLALLYARYDLDKALELRALERGSRRLRGRGSTARP